MRNRFPFFHSPETESLIYLDSAATAHKPDSVIEAMHRFLSEEYATVHRAVYDTCALATLRYDAVRDSVCRFLDAESPEEIIFTKGTTEAINLVAYCFGEAFIRPGDEIVITETEHHSNIVPWQRVCERKRGVLKVVPVNNEGEISISALENILSSRTKLIAVAHIANATGAVHPVQKIAEIARLRGIRVLVDAAQSVGHCSLSVRDLGVDFLAFSGHKMYGPTGIGVLYGKRELLEAMPPYQGGGDMVDTVSFEKITYQPPPLKFEAGTPPIAEVIGLGAAIRFLQETGFDAISDSERNLCEYAQRELSGVQGLRFLCLPKTRGPLLTFSLEGCHSLDVGMFLNTQRIAVRTGHLCAQPALRRFGHTTAIRASFAIYNTPEEVKAFVLAVDKGAKFLR